jgi:hypothetical protein
MVSRRFWSTVLFGLGAVLGSAPALAQTGTSTTVGTGTNALATSDFTIKLRRLDGDSWVDITTTDQKLFFNQARCQCDEKVKIVVTMASSAISKLNTTKTGAYARLYVGNNCATLINNNVPTCASSQVAEKVGLSVFTKSGWEEEVSVGSLFKGIANCNQTKATTLWLWVDTQAVGQPDLTGDSAPRLGIELDGAPPPLPTGVSVEGGSEALKVSWNDMSLDNPDIAGYVVFCMRGNGLQVFEPSPWDDQYKICQGVTPLGASSTTGTVKGDTTAVEVDAPSFFQTLDNRYMCSGRTSASQTSTRIRVLQNEIPYTVGVASVDLSGNISPITRAFVQKPIPTVDFYRAYRDAGGETEGGYCSLGRGGRPGLLACLAGVGLLGLFLIRRRRRRSSGGRGLTVLLVLLAAGSAQARSVAVTHEEGKENEKKVDLNTAFEEPRSYRTPKSFAFELRFGPYRPDIDSEFSDPQAHPYKDVYGGKRHLMSQFEIDWQFFQAFGSLSVAGVVGYYSQTAKANIAGTTTPSGDDTNLRLIPTSALLVYRFDVLALRYGIPLAPYGKLGLNYTFWRITDGNGDVSHYVGGRGSGGTLGWQGAIGMALMLDFIDPTAARGLDVETGVNHTYFFFEWNKVAANGLGQSKKLHVGDSRWVLGLMFEF